MTVGEVLQLIRTRRLRYHLQIRYSHIDPWSERSSFPVRLVQVPARCVAALLDGLPSEAVVSASLSGKDLIIGT